MVNPMVLGTLGLHFINYFRGTLFRNSFILAYIKLGIAIHGPIPVSGETFEELSGPLVHTNFARKRYGPVIGPYEFPPKLEWTNGPESSSKVSPYIGIGPCMAIPCKTFWLFFLIIFWSFCESGEGVRLPGARGWPSGKSGELLGKSGELPGKSGKLSGNLWIAVRFHRERSSIILRVMVVRGPRQYQEFPAT